MGARRRPGWCRDDSDFRRINAGPQEVGPAIPATYLLGIGAGPRRPRRVGSPLFFHSDPLRDVVPLPGQVIGNRLWLGDHLRAIEFYSNNINTLQGDLAKDRLGMAGIPLVFSRGHLSWPLAELGRFPEAIAEWREAIRLAEEVKHPFSEAFAKYCGGFLYLRKGEIERAIAQLEPGFALCRSMHLRLELPFVASFLGIAYAYEGRHSEGIAMAEHAVNEMNSLKIQSGRSWIVGFLGYAYLIAGQHAKAVELMQQALELAQLHGERGWVAWEHHVLGLARMAEGGAGIEKAHNLFEQAIEGARALQLRPLLARSELALGQLHRRAGQEDSARKNIGSAVSLLREMQMPIWLQKAEAELQALN